MQFARAGFGSTQTFDMYNARGFTWIPVARTLILGLRGDTRFSTGDVPFYAQPYVWTCAVCRRDAIRTAMP